MDIQILEQGRMSQSGKSLIRSVQAMSIPKLDLLVRESVQNSLDASLRREPKTRVDMDFVTGKFNAKELNAKFKHITSQLNGRYRDEEYQFIAIRDSKTYGLTGTDDTTDHKSRLQSLVYHISKNQTEEGSGGSWGLGKTTFFGLGMGLVAYYSRTFEADEYISKLAAVFVEDEDNDPLVYKEDSRGISFFGKYRDGAEPPSERNETVPITDEAYIKNFLKIFDNISPYEGEETGTTIIVPYVNFNSLLDEITSMLDENGDYRQPVWASSVESYLKIALQRWYFPRLANPNYQGSWLKACVNGDCISKEKMHPFFRLYQELYNVSLDKTHSSEILNDFKYELIKIDVKSVKGQTAGYVVASYVDIHKLNLTNEYYRNIYSYVGQYHAALGSPIVTFTRKAGMLVRYEIEGSKWIPRLDSPDENKTLMAVFRLASDKSLNDGSSLEEYVRASEKSDHNNWEDHGSLNIIERISANTGSKLKDAFSTKEVFEYYNRSNLSGLLSEILLPARMSASDSASEKQTDFASGTGTKRRKGKHGPGTKSRLDVIGSLLEDGIRTIEFYIRSDSASNTADVYFEVNGERGSVSYAEWESEFGTEFPLSVIGFELSACLEKSDGSDSIPNKFNFANAFNSFDDCTVISKTSVKGAVYGMHIRTDKPGFEFRGKLAIRSNIQSASFEIKHVSPGEFE